MFRKLSRLEGGLRGSSKSVCLTAAYGPNKLAAGQKLLFECRWFRCSVDVNPSNG